MDGKPCLVTSIGLLLRAYFPLCLLSILANCHGLILVDNNEWYSYLN